MWTEFGAGLPNALVTDLRPYRPASGVNATDPARGDVLVVTLGRGARFRDAQANVAAPGVLQISAISEPLTVTLARNTANRSLLAVSVTEGVGASSGFEQKLIQGSSLHNIVVTGLAGAQNTLIIDSSKRVIDGPWRHSMRRQLFAGRFGAAGRSRRYGNTTSKTAVSLA